MEVANLSIAQWLLHNHDTPRLSVKWYSGEFYVPTCPPVQAGNTCTCSFVIPLYSSLPFPVSTRCIGRGKRATKYIWRLDKSAGYIQGFSPEISLFLPYLPTGENPHKSHHGKSPIFIQIKNGRHPTYYRLLDVCIITFETGDVQSQIQIHF